MDVFSPPTTRLTLKWVSLGVALLLLLLHCATATADAREENWYGEDMQQRRSCYPQRLSSCRDYLERRRERPSERCCEELQRMSPQCRCRAIQEVFDQSSAYDSSTEDLFMDSEAALNQRRRHRREGRGREEEEVEERAKYLPNTCNVQQPPRRCDVRRGSRYFRTGSGF